jgi:hypothetical protein
MEKVSEDVIVKTAHLMGVTQAMLDKGYTHEGVKLAYVQSGLFPEDVAAYFVKAAAETDLTKEAIAPAIIAGIASVGSKVAPWLLRGAKAIGRFAGKTKGSLMQGGKASQMAGKAVGGMGAGAGKVVKGLGKKTYQATGAIRQAGQAYQKAPVKAVAGGAANFGKGLVFGGGKGVGGGLGRGAMYGSMGAGALATAKGLSNRGQQQAQAQQQMYPQQRMYGG